MKILFDDKLFKTVLMDSISYVKKSNQGDIIVSGSHGGTSSARYAIEAMVGAVFFNDAGGGKNKAGIRGLDQLNEHNIIAAAVRHDCSEIGIAEDTYAGGLISHVNSCAEKAGLKRGMPVMRAVAVLREYFIN